MTGVVEVVLHHRRLYILPSRNGLLFSAVLLVLLLTSVKYGNSMGYALTFLLASIAAVSMLHTHRNLLRLRIGPGPCAPVFAGQTATFHVCVSNDAPRPRYGVCLELAKEEETRVDVPGQGSVLVGVSVPALRRGRQPAPTVRLSTRFPLGLLYCWTRRLAFDQHCLVYPRPGPPRPLPTGPAEAYPPSPGLARDGEDFAGVREFRPGDSPRHVDWKAVAREQRWYTKQFAGGPQSTVWLDWEALPGLDTEERLSQMCRWVLDAEREGLLYGLRLPGVVLPPGHGEDHRHRCLKALALFPSRP